MMKINLQEQECTGTYDYLNSFYNMFTLSRIVTFPRSGEMITYAFYKGIP